MADGDIDHHTGSEHSGKLVLKTVVDVGVAHQIGPFHRDIRQQTGSSHLYIRFGHLVTDFQQFNLLTIIPNILHVKCLRWKERFHVRIFCNLVITGQIQSAKLIEHHFRQCQAIFRFGETHLRFVEFHAHLGQVALRGHALCHHRLHVLVQGVQQITVLTSE